MGHGNVEFSFLDDDGDFDVEAHIDGIRVGYAWGIRDGDRLHLTDIRVDEFAPCGGSMLPRVIQSFFPPAKLRGTGVGRELLRRFLRNADTAGVCEVWGSVTEDDLRNWPGLLDWYGRYGFVVREPDSECINIAFKKIVRGRAART
jgi:hypothetical protein